MAHQELTAHRAKKTDWRAALWSAQSIRIGVVPLPIYMLLTLLIIGFVSIDKVSSDLTMAIGILSVGGFFFMELGRRIPILGLMGGAAIMTFVVPSAAVFYGFIPPSVASAVTAFCKQSNFLYLYISAIIVGSIISMDRQVLVEGFLKILLPLAAGSIVALLVGTLVGMAMGLTASHSLFFIVTPIMAGGLGEGAIPLSVGYSLILHQPQETLFAQIIPVVMLASFTAVLLCGLLNLLGKYCPQLTGEGQLQPGTANVSSKVKTSSKPLDITDIAAAGVTIVSLYLLGVYIQKLTAFPAPITMLFLVVAAKIGRMFNPVIENGSRKVYRFFSSIVTWPLLFAMGVALTPWDTFIAVFTLPTVVTVFATVSSLIATGFITARLVHLYPIDTAIVAGCHSGQGGTGDIAILTAANRMELMPFAQIATRIGGAITVSFAITMLRYLT
ncbi:MULTISPECIES: 2-hydroxycarboxylate transporter family protein [Ochrobactrum]|jgi:malate:Na+ symporter|uniref:2-hydroxycarboxylate transporter family protein n=1 Tax=Ochrobactrum quorumnocens TaxID=271865 RepID=A0A5N1JMQ4_9HYPH|nr:MULTISPECIES: 2-hydroxycarboxylate transporter family protein [Brucella/Ochrobactrum group]KAA9354547.1 2-hydroxycarboxylate transporter family protein [[Ochrobactrum] quorumnocens]MBD7993480.1 2-hydroxycarboxylate transporter family protein [Ochrobactrum gallinarum]MDH7793801.1 malate:Na+ symporter [Ochrobactrum sp. AN78]